MGDPRLLIAARYFVIVVNVCFCVFGAVMTALGAKATQDGENLLSDYPILSDLPLKAYCITALCIGIAVIILSIVGFVGAWKKNRKMLTVYCLFLFAVAVFQLAIGIALYVLKNNPSQLDRFVESQWTPSNAAIIASIQNDFMCCGYSSLDDSKAFVDCNQNYTQTCRDAILAWLSSHMGPIALACIICAVIEVMVMVVSCIILCTRKEKLLDDPWFNDDTATSMPEKYRT